MMITLLMIAINISQNMLISSKNQKTKQQNFVHLMKMSTNFLNKEMLRLSNLNY